MRATIAPIRAASLAFAFLLLVSLSLSSLNAQTAAVPAGADAPLPTPPRTTQVNPDISAKDRREADDAYLRGARALDGKDLTEAEAAFSRATRLNPRNRDYALALAVTREHRLTDLVQRAAQARAQGHAEEADRLLVQAREIDPKNAVVLQHFSPDGTLAPAPFGFGEDNNVAQTTRAQDALTLAGPVQLTPQAGTHDFHLRTDARNLLLQICGAYGIRADIVNSIDSGPTLRFDLDHATFADALRAAQTLTHTFSVPLEPTELLISHDSADDRAQYTPLIEETLYLPGATQTELNDYANMTRQVFNFAARGRVVNAVANSSSLVLRADEDTLTHVNATFADLLDGGSEILLDLTLYEVDKSRVNNIGVQAPSSVGVFPVAATALNLISANQSLISQAIANNLITLTGNAYADALTELEFLLASGTVSSSQFSSLLGVFGHYGGLPLAGVFLGSSTTANLALTSSDVRLVDTVQLRLSDNQKGQFRIGTRYPIETGIYSSSLSSNLTAATAGLSINGTSVSSLLSQYLGSTSVSVPQIQFEDLGLTLEATPQLLRSGEVSVNLNFKIEALGSGSINTLPILNNRQLISTITIPPGKTAMLASALNNSELRAVTGIPLLNEIPGFGGTNKDTEKDSSELLITLTPHVVRNRNFHIASRRLLLANTLGNTQ